MNFTIQAADYHRNGISGKGFYVGLITDHDNDDRTMLVTWFPNYLRDGETLVRGGQTKIAVVDVALAAAGNIYMHPTGDQAGGNAWRGDHYIEAALAIRDAVNARYDAATAGA